MILIAFALAMDAFAVAISAGVTLPRLTGRAIFRLGFHFGLFQFMMPILGWFAGLTIESYIKAIDHWIAFGLLSFIGGKMIYEALRSQDDEQKNDPTRGLTMVMLSVATSIDALAIGLSMAMLGVRIWAPSVVIGLVAGGMTVLGMVAGQKLGRLLGNKMELTGGLILIGIGVKILIEDLFFSGA